MENKNRFSIIIENGLIVDGSGGELKKHDIGIISDRIAKIGDLSGFDCEKRIDATGLIVCPGFIDTHTHTDKHSAFFPFAEGKIMQGVTTDVCGLCGTSFAPISEDGLEEYIKRNRDKLIEGIDAPFKAISVKQFYDETNLHGNATNIAMFVGNSNLRIKYSGYSDNKLSEDDLSGMKDMLRVSMEEGAFGLSTGLTYVPSMFSNVEELIELCKMIVPFDGIYNSHMRNEGNEVKESIKEVIKISKESGCRGHISHLKILGIKNHGEASECLRLIDEANQSGQKITFDVYPYTAGSTSLSTLLPGWVLSEGFGDGFRIFDEKRDLIENDIKLEDWDNLILSCGYENIVIGNAEGYTQYEGKSLSEIAKEKGINELDAIFTVLRDSKGMATMIYHAISEEDLEMFMSHPKCTIGTDAYSRHYDGPTAEGKPHPRNYGAFPRYINKYIFEKKLFSLEEGIHKITGLAAETFGIKDRGLIKEKYFADITIFDQNKIRETGSYAHPNCKPEGIEWVIVNGKTAVEKGGAKHIAAGKMLKYKI